MSGRGSQVQPFLRWGALGLAVLVAVAATTGDADARSRRARHHKAAATSSYNPPTASIVVDGNSGKVLQASNPDAPRHPASLTKMMTLYLLFERLDSGKVKLTSEMPVSAHAAAQAPSKMGLKPGETIPVESAIKAIVTKSANDVAVVIGEYLGGDESSFARMMTAKAQSLGMMHTTYRNASGLPNDEQFTTARDQAILGRALQDRFPNYFAYFKTRAFAFRGRTIRGHNRLLGSVDGVDGIKTGYIRDSGFNIVTSVNRDNRHIVAVVFGGRTARARDAVVRNLIDDTIKVAAVRRTAPPVGEGTAVAETKLPAKPPAPTADPRPEPVAVAAAVDAPETGSTDPIKPNTVRTLLVRPGKTQVAALSELPPSSRKMMPPAHTASVSLVTTVKSDLPPPPPGAAPGVLGVLPAKAEGGTKLASAGANVPIPATPPEPAAAQAMKSRSGWMIQVGAFPEEKAAKERLSAAQTKAKQQLGEAAPFTEKVAKGERSLYRARFAGLDKPQAEAACKHLKQSEIPCMLIRN
ncbi:MAG: D-alanyl-D-alanine carboxypeptidase [Proteobacteria bacterium]|nr:D-alanyl-D-alanine carboxypeptidase [Pseudomonadota bacterium]